MLWIERRGRQVMLCAVAILVALGVAVIVAGRSEQGQAEDPFAWAIGVECRYILPASDAARKAACVQAFVERQP